MRPALPSSATPYCSRIASRRLSAQNNSAANLLCRFTEQAIECQRPMDAANFFFKAVRSQEIAHPPVGSHDTKRDTASVQLSMKFVQHARACKIDIGRRRQIANNESNSFRANGIKSLE